MIDLSTPNEWQHVDPSNGLVFPWYVKSFLDELATWDLSDKTVFEFGCGASSLWWANKCNKLYGVENSAQWFSEVARLIGDKVNIELRTSIEYPDSIYQWVTDFDVVIIDGVHREGCVAPALCCLKPGGKLIYDNWMQPSVEVQSQEIQHLLLSMPHQIYHQEGHPDWKTLVVTKC